MPSRRISKFSRPGTLETPGPRESAAALGSGARASFGLALVIGLIVGSALTVAVQRLGLRSAGSADLVAVDVAADRASSPLPPVEGPGAAPEALPGAVEFSAVDLVPPSENLAREGCPMDLPTWTLAGETRETVDDLLEAAKLGDAERAEARGFTVCKGDGCFLRPTLAFIAALSQSARGEIYRRLAGDMRNIFQYYAIRFRADEIDSWFARSSLSSALQITMRSMLYRQADGLWAFADLPAVCAAARSRVEQEGILRSMYSEHSLSGTVRVRPGDNLEPLVRYWGADGRVTARVRAALEEGVRSGRGIVELQDLLPPSVARRVNSYPASQDAEGVNCHWTSLNFFASEPDPSFRDGGAAFNALNARYERVPLERPRYGDVLAIVSDGDLLHTAVYIADGVYLTKNGRSHMRPWTLARGAQIRKLYPLAEGIQEILFRPPVAPPAAD